MNIKPTSFPVDLIGFKMVVVNDSHPDRIVKKAKKAFRKLGGPNILVLYS